jgi:hypothetical protein
VSKHSKELAYAAGRALPSVVWPDDYPEDKKHLGMHHCPFFKGNEDYEAYARGLRDALSGDTTDRANLLKSLNDDLKVTSHAK